MNELAEPPATPRGRLHPLAILVFARRMVGASILPVVVVAFTWRPTFVVPGLLALVAVGLALVVLEWRRFTYRIESGRLVIERGVFRHTTRVVPLDRIRGVELQAPWLHRVLGLVRVDVEAASGGSEAAELTLAAVAADEGERLRRVLLAGARPAPGAETEEAPPARVLFHACPPLLVAGGLTSGRHILAPLVVVGVITNFADDLPGGYLERLVSSAADRAPTDVLGVSLLVVAALAVTALLAAAGSLLADWEFELADDGERLLARRGLLTSRAVVIDRARVRGIDLRDSPLRRAFDLVGVHAIAGGIGGGRSGRTVLAPVIRMEDARALIRELDPGARLDTPLLNHPAAARTRRIVRAVTAPLALSAGAFAVGLPWAGAALVVLAVAGVPLGIDRYRQLGHGFDGRRLAVREGSLSRRWTSLAPAAVISYVVERSPFQARVGLCTIVLHLGQGAGTRRVLDCSGEQAASLLAELDAPLLGPFVTPTARAEPVRPIAS